MDPIITAEEARAYQEEEEWWNNLDPLERHEFLKEERLCEQYEDTDYWPILDLE